MAAQDSYPKGRDKASKAPSKSLYALRTHQSGRVYSMNLCQCYASPTEISTEPATNTRHPTRMEGLSSG